MLKVYEIAIAQCDRNHKEIHTKISNLLEIHHMYRTRSLDYWLRIMLLCSLMPCAITLVAGLVLILMEMMSICAFRWRLIGVTAFCSFFVAPFVVKYQQNTVKEYNGRLTDKSHLEIQIDYFKNYLEQVQAVSEDKTNDRIIERLEEERQNQKDRDELITTLRAEYNISPQKPAVKSNRVDEYLSLNKKYKEELIKQNQHLAVANCFKEEFKHDWMQSVITGMMAAVVLVLWGLFPVLAVNSVERQQLNEPMWLSLANIILLVIVGFCLPFFIRGANKKRKHKAFESVSNLFNIDIDTTQYSFEAQDNFRAAIDELQDKISLTTVKIIKSQNI